MSTGNDLPVCVIQATLLLRVHGKFRIRTGRVHISPFNDIYILPERSKEINISLTIIYDYDTHFAL